MERIQTDKRKPVFRSVPMIDFQRICLWDLKLFFPPADMGAVTAVVRR
jgi:hypothetical protein